MRTLAIGDIHGCRNALECLIQQVRPTRRDRLITLGDHVDRGPDSRGVLDDLLDLHARGQVISLRGNHDWMMAESRWDPMVRRDWLKYGGNEALRSYVNEGEIPHVERVPAEHWGFLNETMIDWFETDTHIYLHASYYPEADMADQPEHVLHWEKLRRDIAPHTSGKIVVCGHTPQTSGIPLNLGHVICIDTFVYDPDGWLTCLHVETGRYWQANERGETRTGKLEFPPE